MTDSTMVVAPDAKEDTFSLSLKGEGIEVNKSIDQHTAVQVLSLIMGAQASQVPQSTPAPVPQAAANAPAPTPTIATSPQQTVKEFVDSTEAERNPDIITAIAYYMLHKQGKQTFTTKEMREHFGPGTGFTPPKNFSRDFKTTVKGSWIAAVSGKKNTYHITGTGEKAVEAKFAKEVRGRTVRKAKSKKKA